MKYIMKTVMIIGLLCLTNHVFAAASLTIATVDNGDMVRMQKLSEEFAKDNPSISLNWQVMDESEMRRKVSDDIVLKTGKYDIMTIGALEVPIWANKGWLTSLSDLSAEYDINDLIDPVREALSVDGQLYASPFNAESSMMIYRKDLFDNKGLSMPDKPTWNQVYDFAKTLHNPDKEQYGICLRGGAGWGENITIITTMANSYGARWFDMNWEAEFTSPEWRNAANMYVDILQKYGPPNVEKNGFKETLAEFQAGKCAMWVDATSAASFVSDKAQSLVHDKVAFVEAPRAATHLGANWFWSWSLAIPSTSNNKPEAKQFVEWATSKGYMKLVADKEGWENVPPGTRKSLYANPNYISAAPYAKRVLNSIQTADAINGSLKPKPYTGIQFVAIPEFPIVATPVSHFFSLALSGKKSVSETLEASQDLTNKSMIRAGYLKKSDVEEIKLDQHAD